MKAICIGFKIKREKAIKTTINTEITEKKTTQKENILVTVY